MARSASSGSRRLAPRRLGRGRLRRADAESAAERSSSGCSASPPASTCCSRGATRAVRSSSSREKVLEPPFYVGPDFTWRPRLVSSVTFTKKPPFTLTYRIHPRARWSDGVPITAQRLRLHSPGEDRAQGELTERSSGRRAGPERPRARREDVRVVLRRRFAGWRALFGNILPRHALAGEKLGSVWTDGIVNPKTGRPIGSGPFLVRRWERGRAAHARPEPALLGTASRLPGPDRHPGSARERRSRRVVPPGRAGRRLGLLPSRPRGSPQARPPGRRRAQPRFEHFAIRVGPGGHPALKNKLVRRALAYGDRSRGDRAAACSAPSRRTIRSDSLLLVRPSPRYRPNWGGYRRRPAEARRLLEQAGCRRGADGIYSCAGQRLSLRFVTSAGIPPRARS